MGYTRQGIALGAVALGLLVFAPAEREVFGATTSPVAASAAGEALSEHDCSHACNDCQKACWNKSAGSERTDCMRACTSSAVGCCVGNGKKPPQGLSCYCQ